MSFSVQATSLIRTSPMILSDRLLSLAQDAERAGCLVTAEHLLTLAHTVFDERTPLRQ